MPNVLIGCGPFPPKRDRAAKHFGCIELSESMIDPIRHATLRKWNKERPEGFQYILGAWRWLSIEPLDEKRQPPLDFPLADFGLFRDTAANRAVWAETRAQADALEADGVLFRTPPAFSPSAKNLDNLRKFRAEVIGDVPFELLWEARGIWVADELTELGEELGMTIVRDPHGESVMPDPTAHAYYAITAPIGHLRFSEDDLFDLSDFLDAHPTDVRAVFRGPDREHNARALINLRRKLAGEPPIQ